MLKPTYTTTKTFLHAAMHVKCFETVYKVTRTQLTLQCNGLISQHFREQNHAKRSKLLIKTVIRYLFCNAKVTN